MKATLKTKDVENVYRLSFEKSRNKFRLRKQTTEGKLVHVGYYATMEDARKVVEDKVTSINTQQQSKKVTKATPAVFDAVIDSLDGIQEVRLTKVHNFYSTIDDNLGLDLHVMEDVHVNVVNTFYELVKSATSFYWSFLRIKF